MSIWSRRATMQTTFLAATPEGTGRSGRISLSVAPNIESMRRRDPPRTASHLASVAHVPIYEIGSRHMTGHLRHFAAACCLVLILFAPWAGAQPGFQALPPAEWIQLRYFEPK